MAFQLMLNMSLTRRYCQIDEKCVFRHCRVSQYNLQIVKCADPQCCSPTRCKWTTRLRDRYLPPPIPIRCNEGGPIIPDNVSPNDKFSNFYQRLAMDTLAPDFLVYETYCPSLTGELNDLLSFSSNNEASQPLHQFQ